MRLQHDVGEVKSRGFGETSNFKIAMSAHAFKVLSSQVYGNPTLATIRELICNAVDAHRKAGKLHVPVQVQAPSRLDPRFIVKDFGTGLSPEAVVTLYTTYFASDKNDSDELIGGLGIGAKAPFSNRTAGSAKTIFASAALPNSSSTATGSPAVIRSK